jgi:hypothetical protein
MIVAIKPQQKWQQATWDRQFKDEMQRLEIFA